MLQHAVFVFGHPSKYQCYRTAGLTLLSGRNMLLSLWYSVSTLNAFFFQFLVTKGTEKYMVIGKWYIFLKETLFIKKNFRARIYSSLCFIPSRP